MHLSVHEHPSLRAAAFTTRFRAPLAELPSAPVILDLLKLDASALDAEGPCANAVRDSQRTKTHAGTRDTLSVIWGCTPFEQRLADTERWYRQLVRDAGGVTETVGTPLLR